MQYDGVQRHFKRVPFEPLIIRTVSGNEFDVRTRECTITRRCAAFPVEGDQIEFVALEYIESIRPLVHGSGRRGGNGKGRH